MPYACARVVSHDRPPDGASGLQRLVVQVLPHYWHHGLTLWMSLSELKLQYTRAPAVAPALQGLDLVRELPATEAWRCAHAAAGATSADEGVPPPAMSSV